MVIEFAFRVIVISHLSIWAIGDGRTTEYTIISGEMQKII